MENQLMHGRIATVVLLALLLSPVIGSGVPSTDKPAEPDNFFHEFIGLNEDQIREIRQGKAIAKILDSPTAGSGICFWFCLHLCGPPHKIMWRPALCGADFYSQASHAQFAESTT
jgi:hypothetical protein